MSDQVTSAEEGAKDPLNQNTEWFWRIVDSNAEVPLPSFEEDALRLLCRYASRATTAESEVSRLTERLAKVEAENARLRIAFHDAIRRPLGVTPDSGAEFYDARMADEAEERRASSHVQSVISRVGSKQAAARAALKESRDAP